MQVRPEEIQTGTRVRVVDGHRAPHLLGMVGTIERSYRSSSRRTALHVHFDDGRWQLMWPEELEPLREKPSIPGAPRI